MVFESNAAVCCLPAPLQQHFIKVWLLRDGISASVHPRARSGQAVIVVVDILPARGVSVVDLVVVKLFKNAIVG